MEKGTKILVVDDDSSHRTMLSAVLGDAGYDVETADGGDAALEATERESYPLVLLDIKMAGRSGNEVLEDHQRRAPGTAVVMMTAYASVGTAVEALRLGAYDYLIKPFDPQTGRAVVGVLLRLTLFSAVWAGVL
mgnify:CR=1 FL=1